MSMQRPDKVGACALCLRNGILRDSHIISEFLYSALYDDKHRFYVIEAGEKYSEFEQKGLREPLLCADCETKLSVWEAYARDAFVGRHQFRFAMDADGVTWVEGVNYEQLKLFQLSILWRAGVAKQDFFSKVQLGPHAETLRRMLLAGDPGEPWQYGCLVWAVHLAGEPASMIIQPTPFRLPDKAVGLRFSFGGLAWFYRIASHKPAPGAFIEAVMQRSGRHALLLGKLENAGFFRDFIQNHRRKLDGADGDPGAST